MIMNRLLFRSKIAVIIMVLLPMLHSCKFKEPELLGLQDFKVTNFTAKAIKIQVIAKVNNPNNYRISIVKSDLDIFINGENMGKLKLEDKVSFLGKKTDVYTIKLINKPENFAKLGVSSLFAMITSGKLQVNVKGTIKGKAGLISRKFDVDLNEAVSLNRG